MDREQALIVESVRTYNPDLAEAVRGMFEHFQGRLVALQTEVGQLRGELQTAQSAAMVCRMADDDPLGIE